MRKLEFRLPTEAEINKAINTIKEIVLNCEDENMRIYGFDAIIIYSEMNKISCEICVKLPKNIHSRISKYIRIDKGYCLCNQKKDKKEKLPSLFS